MLNNYVEINDEAKENLINISKNKSYYYKDQNIDYNATQSLSGLIKASLERYFFELEGAIIGNIHELVVGEVEKILLEVVMQKTNYNQSKAAKWLGISRNTLRKMLIKYNL